MDVSLTTVRGIATYDVGLATYVSSEVTKAQRRAKNVPETSTAYLKLARMVIAAVHDTPSLGRR